MKITIYIFFICVLYTNCFAQNYDVTKCRLRFKKTEKFYLPDSLHNKKTKFNFFIKILFDSTCNVKNVMILTLTASDVESGKVVLLFNNKKNKKYPKKILKYYNFLNDYLKNNNEVYFQFYHKEIFELKKEFEGKFFLIYSPVH